MILMRFKEKKVKNINFLIEITDKKQEIFKG